MNNIYIFGSINYDLVITSPYMPRAGETLTGSGFFTNSGGKGANQAVACSKLGAKAIMLGAVGYDTFGKECKNTLKGFGVKTEYIQEVKDCNTGIAVIVITDGDNRIILDSGANTRFNSQQMFKVIEQNVKKDDIFICQLEIPFKYVEQGFKTAKQKGAITLLNPAPAQALSKQILSNTDIIIPNESEAQILTDINTDTEEGIQKAHKRLKEYGIKEIIITLGKKGCYYNGKIFSAVNVDRVVDTTAAGDTFIGALASSIARGNTVGGSIDFCQKACALKITKKGAQIGIPTLEEIQTHYGKE